MKTVLFFRHAKSDWAAAYGHDHERPLAARGRKAARAMGSWLRGMGPVPDRILCSTAVRARQTLHRAQKAGGWNAEVQFTSALYGATPDGLLQGIRQQSDTVQTLMLIGHEPVWSHAIELFTGQSCGHFPTAAMARIDLPVEGWREASFGIGTLAWLQRPRELQL